jgi:tetratricopeptide (TPR) repeat protein
MDEAASPTETQNLYTTASSDESDKPQEEPSPVIDKIAETVEEDFPAIMDEAASPTETQNLYTTASSDESDKPQEESAPVIDKIAETGEEDFPSITDEAASQTEPQDFSATASSDKADKPQEEPSPVIDESEEPMEEKNPPSNIGVDDITTSGGSNQLFTDEGGDLENDIIESEIHDIAYYLDLGFAAKESGDYGVAATAFQKAIYIEPDNPSVLYIVIEICALLKLQGFYDDAIRQMEKGRDLALTLNNEVMAGEFNNAIAYLQILSNILSTKHMQSTPYPALPEDVKLEIDEEFRQWKAQAKNDRI